MSKMPANGFRKKRNKSKRLCRRDSLGLMTKPARAAGFVFRWQMEFQSGIGQQMVHLLPFSAVQGTVPLRTVPGFSVWRSRGAQSSGSGLVCFETFIIPTKNQNRQFAHCQAPYFCPATKVCKSAFSLRRAYSFAWSLRNLVTTEYNKPARYRGPR